LADRPKGSSRRFKLFLLAGLVTLTLSLVAGWAGRKAIIAGVGYSLICSQPPRQADLILVLGGDFWGPRVIKAADLAVKGYAPLVLISGPPYGEALRPEGEFAIEFLTAHGYPRKLFAVFGHRARSTIDEAVALGPELRRRQVKRVILVTSAYHSRRADIVVRLFCGNGTQFISVPAPDSYYSPERWWVDPGSRKMFFSEWRKIIGTVFLAYPEYLLSALPRP
jgi:uncharacterized SAM-binding protein YcdF (DUF218 family)